MAHEASFRHGAIFPLLAGTGTRPIAVDSTGTVVTTDSVEATGTFNVTKTGHGLTSGDVNKPLCLGLTLAKADNVGTVETVGMLVSVVDANTLKVQQAGKMTVTGHGWTVGEVYFVSAATAGAVTSTPPGSSGQFIKPMFKVIDADAIEVVDYPAVEVGSDASYYVPTPPAHDNSSGVQGQWSYDSAYYYRCVADNVWYKIPAITSF